MTIHTAEAVIGEPIGLIGYDGTPADWDVRNHIIEFEDCLLLFIHPSGEKCGVLIHPRPSWNFYDEINIAVKFGTGSPEHVQFLESQK